MRSPECMRSKPLLISSSFRIWVIIGSISILPSIYQSTIPGTSVRPRAPPKAVPFHTRPVTSWNGRVSITAPAGATPMMIDWPQPRWVHSSASRITFTLPVQSNNRPAALAAAAPTKSQLIGQAMSEKAVSSGKVTAAEVAQAVFDAVAADRFYIYSHPQALGNVRDRMQAIVEQHNPPDPFAARPDIGERLRAALRAAG